MARLPKPIPPALIAELELTEDGRVELAAKRRERNAVLDRHWPEPTLGDIMELKDRLERERTGWSDEVALVRMMRFNNDQTPEKWAKKLNIPEERRFHSNRTANEINRVVGTMGRNPPKVTIRPAGDTQVSIQRAEKQSAWGGELLRYIERNSVYPVWSRGDDAAAETGLGGFEWYMTDRWQDVEELITSRDPEVDDPDLDKQIDEALRIAGCPFNIRPIDPLSLYFDIDEDGIATAIIYERKHYAQVYENLRDRLSSEELEEAQLPAPGARSWPARQFETSWTYLGAEQTKNFAPDAQGQVECIRYYDKRWFVEIVAGKVVESKEHKLPGVPVFPQFGKLTSNPSAAYMMQGITMGMISQELAINDLFTLALDNQMTYGRPFPVVTTSENGSSNIDQDGQPQVIHLDDPAHPPVLGPGQAVMDAFGAFRGNIDPQFVRAIDSYWQMSGQNPIAAGESPGSDPSGYAINSLTSGAQALYESMLDNKCQTLGRVVDFSRMAVRDTFQETVYLSVPALKGKGIEYIGLGPDDIDEVPTDVSVDPMSDTQRMAFTEWLAAGNNGKYISRRTVQQRGYGGVITDPDDEDKEILRDDIRQMLIPFMAQLIVQTVAQDAFPSPGAPPPGGPPPLPPGGGGGDGYAGATEHGRVAGGRGYGRRGAREPDAGATSDAAERTRWHARTDRGCSSCRITRSPLSSSIPSSKKRCNGLSRPLRRCSRNCTHPAIPWGRSHWTRPRSTRTS